MATPRTSDEQLAKQVTRQARWKAIAWVVSIALGLAIVALLTSLLLSIRSTQIEGTPTGRKLLESSDTIISCTTPSGECYKRSQAQTASALASISDNMAITVTCGVNLVRENPNVTLEDVRRCVQNLTQEKSR